jgi:pyruvate dehydrogenase E1 component beta subunit
MATDILMPALSPTMEEGKLSKWVVKEGDKVSPGDVLAEIETDKATMEVEAVDEGIVAKLFVAEGTEGVKVNTPIAALVAEGEDASAVPEPEIGSTNPRNPKSRAIPTPSRTNPSPPPKPPTLPPRPSSSRRTTPISPAMSKWSP